MRDSDSEDTGCTHSQLLLDHAGRGGNGAGRVMLHHLGELCQVPLHELQGFGGLWKTERDDRAGWDDIHHPLLLLPVLLQYQTDTQKTQVA